MKKEIIITMLILCISLQINAAASPYEFLVDGLNYSLISDTGNCVEVIRPSGTFSYAGDIIVPPSIQIKKNDVTKEYYVKRIAENAFSGFDDLRSVTISEGINEIGIAAFRYAENLNLVRLPESLETIGENAFEGCLSLGYIRIPSKIQQIKDCVFSWCGFNAGALIIEGAENVKVMGRDCFSNTHFNNLSIFKNLEEVHQCTFSCCDFESIDMRELKNFNTERLGHYTFLRCEKLNSIYLPDGEWNSINNAFCDCNNIALIHIEATIPPIIYDDWAAVLPNDCVLEIPVASLENYNKDQFWGRFKNIQTFESSMNPIKTNSNVQTCHERIINKMQTEVIVTDANGIILYKGNDVEIKVPSGIYVVTSLMGAQKIIVP